MRPHAGIVLILVAAVAFGGPLVVAVLGLRRRGEGSARPGPRPAWPWRLTLASTLFYALAFNLVFFVQELFLVLAKAVTPGLHPVLFHNNHDWTGANPLAELEQGSGALAALAVGLAAVGWLKRARTASATARLFAVWIAYNGLFDALPQLVAGAVLPRQDVGRALSYLGLPLPVIWLLAAAALAGMAVAGLWLARPLLALADAPARVDSPARRTGFVFQAATLPILLGTVLVLPFRVPGAVDQVAIVPAVIGLLGLVWIQASAWRAPAPELQPGARPPSLLVPAVALAAVLAVFQLVLRPGVAF